MRFPPGRRQPDPQTGDSSRWPFGRTLGDDFARDIRYGQRLLARAPGFAAVSILTLALGIGAATAVFSVVDGVLLRPLPYPEPDRILRLYQVGSNGSRMNVSEPNFEDWKAAARSFRAMAQIAPVQAAVSIGSERVMLTGAAVSREFFEVMGVQPAAGRAFVQDEQYPGGGQAVIVSHRLWEGRLGSTPLQELTLRIGDEVHDVVGVMPPSFAYPVDAEYWVPRELLPPQRSRTAHNFQVVARLDGGVHQRAAGMELSELSRALKARYGDDTWMADAAAIPLRDQLTAAARPTLLMLFGAAALLLLIACLNVSNLQLARAATRRRELAVRMAIGAHGGRITRQLLAEALVLSGAGAALGTGLAMIGVRALVARQPPNLPRLDDVAVHAGVLGFAAGVGILTAVVLGLVSAVRTSRGELAEALRAGQRTLAGGPGERLRQALVVAQVASTIVLLAGAALLGRSLLRVLAVDPGFRTDNALVLDLTWPYSADPGVRLRRVQTQQELLTRLRSLPGMQDAGIVSAFPIGPGNFNNGQFIEMSRPDEIQSFEDFAKVTAGAQHRTGFASYRIASAGYFTSMGIPVVRGRLFEDGDGPEAPPVALVSESLAARQWPAQDPIGRLIQFGNMDGDLRGMRIVGIVGDVREVSTESLPGPILYGHYQQRPMSRFSVVARGTALSTAGPAARQIVRELDAELPVQVRTVEEALGRAVEGRRFSLTLVMVFGMAALVLAALGVYGVMSFFVAQRTREIGIRMALGARPADIRLMVVARGARLAGVGMAAGFGAALVLTRYLEGMLFGIDALDTVSYAAVVAVTIGTVLVASYVPAWRATRLAPIAALRAEGS
jgi:putative ABC transport system permease protein